ncbi:hypothetical protein [Aquimarina sp. 2201CG5-10]|uniref:hypothetical protein n=1 Tax=Aquimarina callyspongiae TaxID=3098150 RepID=UPI002AB5C2F9|nr:hypothetical protein [Aquimarina sp. 2201CG5-10]MDY8138656.1 hypothetical protein [Aquimarina sp. 2201CG5-10]
MKKTIIVLLLIITNSYAQNHPAVDKIFDSNTQYFSLNRDVIHLHLNKTTYVTGDEIWFKAYLRNRTTQKPALSISNIYLTLIDSQGTELTRNLFYAEKGISSGSILIDNTIKTGTYYLKAYTKYDNNFIEDESFTTTIQIVNPSEQIQSSAIAEQYDVQLLPEGGHLVQDVLNVVGCKITDANGRGVYITEAIVKDDLGEVITTFKSNSYGLGKFTITPLKERAYKVYIKINGRSKEINFPEANKRGIALSTSKHVTKDLLLVYLKTNPDTYQNIKDKAYHLVIHQDKKAKALPASFIDNNQEVRFVIPFSDLYPGTNSITLFDDQANPVAERLVFNHTIIPKIETEIQSAVIINDSIKVSLKNTLETKGIKSNMSISVLPEETLANRNPENIFASFLIKPYIKGEIENPDQYFSNINRKSLYNLDLLLLTQGWSKYSWGDIFNREVKELFKREQGISMFVNVNQKNVTAGTTLSLTSLENGIFESYDLSKNKALELKNFALLDSSTVRFSLLKNGKSSKAPVSVRFEPSQTDKTPSFKKFKLNTKKIIADPINASGLQSFITGSVELEEVLIKTVKDKEDDFTDIRGLTLGANGRIIDDETEKQFKRITDLIRTYGFQIGRDQNARLTIKKSNRGQDSFILGTVTDPIIFLNGNQLQSQNLDILDGMLTSDVSRIYHKERENSYGRDGNAGVIYIYTKKNLSNTGSDVTFNEFKVPFGFTAEKQFYLPRYASYTSDVFVKYGIIHWNPNVNTDKQGNASFTILNTASKKVNLYIQGMQEDGTLLSKFISLDIR